MITNPVIYAGGDKALVDAFEKRTPSEKKGSYWSSAETEALRSRIKSHYIAEQGHHCCYCNRHLATDNHRIWDVEHVASRVDHPAFMFEPLNLAAACVDCNLRKGQKDPLVNKESMVNPDRRTYPKTSGDFRIIHPHFDNFDDHIKVGKWVYVGKTPKGRLTIYACDLLRYAEKYMNWLNSAQDRSFEEELDAIFGDDPVEAAAVVSDVVATISG